MKPKNLRTITNKEADKAVEKGMAKYLNFGDSKNYILKYYDLGFYIKRETAYEILSGSWIN